MSGEEKPQNAVVEILHGILTIINWPAPIPLNALLILFFTKVPHMVLYSESTDFQNFIFIQISITIK